MRSRRKKEKKKVQGLSSSILDTVLDILLHKNDLYKKNVEFLGINKRL